MWVPSSFRKQTKRASSMPLRWEGVAGNRMRSDNCCSRLELDLVVGPGQHPNPLGGVLIFLRHSIRQAELFGLESGAKIFQRKRLPEFVHDPAREFAGQSQFREFPPEQRLLIQGVWDLARLGEEASGREYLDPLIGMDDTGSKSDGGNVPFPGGAQAENKPQSAGRQIRSGPGAERWMD